MSSEDNTFEIEEIEKPKSALKQGCTASIEALTQD